MALIYKICPEPLWRRAVAEGVFRGSPKDLSDGFIHFSDPGQVAETLTRHFADEVNLVLVAVEASRLGAALRYEPARGGKLFPHLYGPLDPKRVAWVREIPFGQGAQMFPEGMQ